MGESHFECFFNESEKGLSTPLSESMFTMNSNSEDISLIEIRVFDKMLDLKKVRPNNTSAQMVMIKILLTCKLLLDEKTFHKDWFDFLVLRNKFVKLKINKVLTMLHLKCI